MILPHSAKKEILEIARRTLEKYLESRALIEIVPSEPALIQRAGAFVTLEKMGELRGCIGHMTADRPLHLMVQQMAIQAATGDPRFPPVTKEELKEIEIELSILSQLRLINEPSEIVVGEHGLVVSEGLHRGVLLPQVAIREGWEREKFLGYTCLKAGLSFDRWKVGTVQIEAFTAEVFGEKEVLK